MLVWLTILGLSALSFVPLCSKLHTSKCAKGVSPSMLWLGFVQGALLTGYNGSIQRFETAAMFSTMLAGFGCALILLHQIRGRPPWLMMIPIAVMPLLWASPLFAKLGSVVGVGVGVFRVAPQIWRTLTTRTTAGLSPWFFVGNVLATSLAMSVEWLQPQPVMANVVNFSVVLGSNCVQLGVFGGTVLATQWRALPVLRSRRFSESPPGR